MLRIGLCCLFKKEQISFRIATATFLKKKNTAFRLQYLSDIIFSNCQNLLKALEYCLMHQIGDFRITSRFFPLFTHPETAYKIEQLPRSSEIFQLLEKSKSFARQNNLRLTLHPDQFVILNSPNFQVVENAIKELEYHNYLADLVGADVINIHAGGGYKDKKKSLQRLQKNLKKLSSGLHSKLTLENDDRIFTPQDLLPLCREEHIPFVYDIHHHRCLKDNLSEEEATQQALLTWKNGKEALFHLSSPKEGYQARNPKLHADFINFTDFPQHWLKLKKVTIEIEAKAKELAIFKLIEQLKSKSIELQP